MVRKSLLLGTFLVLLGCQQTPDNSYGGYVESQTVSIAAPQSGWLSAVDVDRGDTVRDGQPLFRLDATAAQYALAGAENRATSAQAQAADLAKGARDADIAPLTAQRFQAQSQLDLALANEARYAQLEPKGYVSATQMDSLRAATKSARAQLANIDRQIEEKRLASRVDQQRAAQAQAAAASADVAGAKYTVDDRDVKARLTGLVDERLREPGEFVAAGSAVLTVRPQGREFVRFYVPQSDLAKFRVGGSVRISCDGCKGQTGKVRFISPSAEFTPPVIYSVRERQKLMFLIEATPESPNALHAGQPVDVRL
ncbi:HlyD family secretion protein [Asticcacaulis sp. 201]|uniref:HlyD family secretion protein n=1 Tax=Asticcacaulis sp. 201 TaxID=3028787 RepID=UPI0029164BDB|nr:HlyD family efflux transporter periplasmic adaptor subunit [Asticcacaulis sp. 201]MDV6329839.1 HlyD family efflux transporter periplasmic adaptor subunit [Asticcacaulis sp. 201]